MNITHLNTFDVEGGAARAAYRLHQGLLKIGENSRILCKHKKSQDNTVLQILGDNEDNKDYLANFRHINTHYIYNNRTSVTNTLFSCAYPGFELAPLPIIENSDVINLHWVANEYQSPLTIKNLLDLGKPLIWTLHDMWAFTGGCHYSAGCQGYETDCSSCPQLKNDIYNLTNAILQDKIPIFNHPNLVIVSPSQWLADCAKKSQVFRHNRVEIIPNSLDTEVFTAIPKSSAKASLNILPEEIVLLVGSSSAKERRKGFYELIEILKLCQENEGINQLIKDNKIRICCFGETIDNFQELDFKVTPLGIVNSDEKLSQIYSAADVFILPSLEDNLPNTMLEAMSCGTPVIGFNLGGIPDLVTNEVTGFVTPENDIQAMADKIIELIFNPKLRENMAINCRQMMIENHALDLQAKNYVNLYKELLNENQQNTSTDKPEKNAVSQEEGNQLLVNLNWDCGDNFNQVKDNIISYSVHQELNRLRGDLKELYNILDGKNLHIEKTEKLLEHTHQQLVTNQNKLGQTQVELNQIKWRLNDTQGKLNHTQGVLAHTQEQLNHTQNKLAQTQGQLTETQDKLDETQAQLNQSNGIIRGMESSKFWQLRNKWFALKAKLGMKENE